MYININKKKKYRENVWNVIHIDSPIQQYRYKCGKSPKKLFLVQSFSNFYSIQSNNLKLFSGFPNNPLNIILVKEYTINYS